MERRRRRRRKEKKKKKRKKEEEEEKEEEAPELARQKIHIAVVHSYHSEELVFRLQELKAKVQLTVKDGDLLVPSVLLPFIHPWLPDYKHFTFIAHSAP